MSLVQRTIDGQSIRCSGTYGVMVGVGPDGSLIPIATDANGNVLMTTNGTPGVLSDAIELTRSPLYAPTAGINPQGGSQLFAVDAQGRVLVAPAPGTAFPEVGTTAGTVAAGNDSRFVGALTPELFGAVGDGVTDDTTALQNAINAAEAVGGTVLLASKTYAISAALNMTSAASIVGLGCYPINGGSTANDDALALPIVAPYLGGSVLLQKTAGANGINITVTGSTVNLRGFGIRFAPSIAFSNTGHGVYCMPPAMDTNYRNNGLLYSTWDGVKVFGHDGNHYAYYLCNILLNNFKGLCSWGGGGTCVETNGETGKNNFLGNSVFDHPYALVCAGGSAHGYWLKNTSGETILITMIRPQAFLRSETDTGLVSTIPASPQKTFAVDPTAINGGTGKAQFLTLIARDFESSINGTGEVIPDDPSHCITPGLSNGAWGDPNYTATDAGGFNLGLLYARQGAFFSGSGMFALGGGGSSGIAPPTSGAHLEVYYQQDGGAGVFSGGTGGAYLLAYDRTAAAFKDLWLRAKTLQFSASNGIVMDSLATADPHVAGQLWRNGTALMISAG